MSDFESHVESYLLPRYWGGHSLGYGEPNTKLNVGMERTSDTPVVRDRMHDYLNDTRAPFPMESLRRDAVFDPSQYPEGTMVLAKRESLTRGLFVGNGVAIDFDSLEGLACPPYNDKIPARRTKVMPNQSLMLMDKKGLLPDFNSQVMYRRDYLWGTVAVSNSGTPGLVLVSEKSLKRTLTGWAVRGGVAREQLGKCLTGSIQVGETKHYPYITWPLKEKVERVLAIDVCSHGSPKKENAAKLALLARLALNPLLPR